MTLLKCKRCNKDITKDMEVEYSKQVCEFFCSPDCATDYYYEYMESSLVDLTPETLKTYNIIIKKNKLFIND